MRLCSITPLGGGWYRLRWYGADHSAALNKKSSAVTAPFVTSLIRSKCSGRGIRSPATYREIAACSTPTISPNLACEISLSARNSESFMPRPYHTGMSGQELYTSLVLDGNGGLQYHVGMSELRKLREKKGLSQDALAEAIGTQQPQVSRWELPKGHPKRRLPPIKWAKRLAEFFNVSLTVFRPDIEEASGSIDALIKYESSEMREAVFRAVVETLLRRAG